MFSIRALWLESPKKGTGREYSMMLKERLIRVLMVEKPGTKNLLTEIMES